MRSLRGLLSFCLCGLLLFNAGCASGAASLAVQNAPEEVEGIHVVTTIFPVYDWVKQLSKNTSVNNKILIDNKVDLHSYKPSAEDLKNIASCDLFIYIGGESDEWAEDALAIKGNPNRIVINLMDELGDLAVEEELLEGMENPEEEVDREEPEMDEHIWLSIKNAKKLTRSITDGLIEAYPKDAVAFEENYVAYQRELDKLNEDYIGVFSEIDDPVWLFGSRFPFRYLADECGVKSYAAFSGCAAETEASFSTIKFLSEKVDELGLPVIYVNAGDDTKIAETIRNNTKEKNQKILYLDSMQSVSLADTDNGRSYIGIMRHNLDALRNGFLGDEE